MQKRPWLTLQGSVVWDSVNFREQPFKAMLPQTTYCFVICTVIEPFYYKGHMTCGEHKLWRLLPKIHLCGINLSTALMCGQAWSFQLVSVLSVEKTCCGGKNKTQRKFMFTCCFKPHSACFVCPRSGQEYLKWSKCSSFTTHWLIAWNWANRSANKREILFELAIETNVHS